MNLAASSASLLARSIAYIASFSACSCSISFICSFASISQSCSMKRAAFSFRLARSFALSASIICCSSLWWSTYSNSVPLKIMPAKSCLSYSGYPMTKGSLIEAATPKKPVRLVYFLTLISAQVPSGSSSSSACLLFFLRVTSAIASSRAKVILSRSPSVFVAKDFSFYAVC